MSNLNERARAAIAAFDAALEGDSGDAEIDAAIQMRELLEEFLRSIVLPTKPLESGYILGLRAGWLSGDDGAGLEFDLDSGAGFGNPKLSMSVRFPDGARVTETVDMREVATNWVDRIRSEYKGEPEEDDPTALWTPEMTAAAIRERAQGPTETFGRMYELNEHSEEL